MSSNFEWKSVEEERTVENEDEELFKSTGYRTVYFHDFVGCNQAYWLDEE